MSEPETLADLLGEGGPGDFIDADVATVAQAVFRDDAVPPQLRARLYEYVLSNGAAASSPPPPPPVASSSSSSSSSNLIYSKHRNSVGGFNDEVAVLIRQMAESALRCSVGADDDAAHNQLRLLVPAGTSSSDEQQEQQTEPPFLTELCGLAEHLAARLELTTSAPFIASTVFAMFLVVVADTASSAPSLPASFSSTIFRLSFLFADKYRVSNNNSGMRGVALVLSRLVMQYHLPDLVRHCDQHQVPLAEWVIDSWLTPFMLRSVFFAAPAATPREQEAQQQQQAPPSLGASILNYLSFLDLIIAARDPLIVFAFAAQFLIRNQQRLLDTQTKTDARVCFDSLRIDVASGGQQQPPPRDKTRVLVLHAQQMLRSTPRCGKNRLRHYLYGTPLVFALPGGSPLRQQPAEQQQVDHNTGFVIHDELERYEAQIVLPISNNELTEAFSLTIDQDQQQQDGAGGGQQQAGGGAAATAASSSSPSPPASSNTNNDNSSIDYDRSHRPFAFVVLDCRSERSFHHARLPTAIHIGCDVGYDPALMQSMIERFEGARGSHMCVFGTGKGDANEANLLKIIALRFVQAGFPFVSIAEEGFAGLIPVMKSGRVEVVKSAHVVAAQQKAKEQQQQQQQQRQGNSQSPQQHQQQAPAGGEAAAASGGGAAFLRRAEEVSQGVASWGKSLFSKLSNLTLSTSPSSTAGANGGEGGGDASSSASAGAQQQQQQSSQQQSGGASASAEGRTELTVSAQQQQQQQAGGQNQATPASPTDPAGGSATELPSSGSAVTGGGDSQPFRADINDSDDDDLLSELVTAVVPASSSSGGATSGATTAAAPAVAAPPAPAAGGGEEHHPFDDIFGE